MELFDVYPLFDITPNRGEGCYVWDDQGYKYLDFYGGHAVISIGHSHPHYIRKIETQLSRLGFYSNSVRNPLQKELASKLGALSGYIDYHLFLCNSGAEANENALKLASFHTGKTRVISFRRGFHGRTSAAVAVTDNPQIQAPLNKGHEVSFLPLGDQVALREAFQNEDISSVIVEGLQGIGGIHGIGHDYLRLVRQLCDDRGAALILDEIQSGYGRTGQFFAHQYADVKPDLVTVAKGMGNGFPMAGVLIHPKFKASYGLLGSTFGGNHLACAAGIAVLEVIEMEGLIENARKTGNYLKNKLTSLSHPILEVRGLGLMIGIEFPSPVAELRKKLLFEHNVFTGSSSNKYTLRILPPLNIGKQEADEFLRALESALRNMDWTS